jgi:cytosine/adenosine deaminase-related metal-dependent hydrolase
MTAAGSTMPDGTITIENGRISAVRPNVPIPAGATNVDASGRFVAPGIIDARWPIASDSINQGSTAVSPAHLHLLTAGTHPASAHARQRWRAVRACQCLRGGKSDPGDS